MKRRSFLQWLGFAPAVGVIGLGGIKPPQPEPIKSDILVMTPEGELVVLDSKLKAELEKIRMALDKAKEDFNKAPPMRLGDPRVGAKSFVCSQCNLHGELGDNKGPPPVCCGFVMHYSYTE